MKKGKFGIVLCFYPIAAFSAAILHAPLICAGLAAAAAFLERDEWAARQSLQAWMLSALVFFVRTAAGWGLSEFYIPFFSRLLTITSTVLLVLVSLACVLFSILGIIRTAKGGEANIPLLSDLAYRVYGKVKAKPAPPASQYVPYNPPQPPQAPNMPCSAPPVQQPTVAPYPQSYQVPQYSPPPQQPMPIQQTAPAVNTEQRESGGTAG